MRANDIKNAVVSYISFDFDDSPSEDDVKGVAEWLNKVRYEDAVFFAPIYDGDCIKLVAFSEPISPDFLKRIKERGWYKILQDLDSKKV